MNWEDTRRISPQGNRPTDGVAAKMAGGRELVLYPPL